MSVPSSLQRPAWFPVVEPGQGPPTGSRFAGAPWLPTGEEWPVCPSCGGPIQMFVQLDLDALPGGFADRFGSGLVQLYYCTSTDPLCEVDCEAFFPFAPSVVARRVDASGTGALGDAEVAGAFPARRITGWREAVDSPGWEEAQEHGVELHDDAAAAQNLTGVHQDLGRRTGSRLRLQTSRYARITWDRRWHKPVSSATRPLTARARRTRLGDEEAR